MATDDDHRTMGVGGDTPTCPHTREELTYLGDDGINTYIRCTGCERVFITSGGVALLG